MKKNMIPAAFMAATSVASLVCGCNGGKKSAKGAGERPNVIILYGDDVGYGDLSCNGEPTVCTPNVERLAGEGVRFTNAHTASATSTPARYGLLTGQYPWRKEGTGIAPGDAGMIISPEQFTIADMFRDAGYATAAVGKWHLGLGETSKQDWNGEITPGLSDIGFDYSFIMAATGDRVPCVFIENQRVVGLDPSDPISVSYTTPFEGEPTGKGNPELLKMTPSNGHNQAVINGIPRIGYMKGGKSALWKDDEISDRITEKALEFIRDNKDRPFFLYFGTNDIHVPRIPNEKFAGKSPMGPRGDAILSFDWSVGQVMDLLDSLGIADNTIFILSSDNGPVVDDGYNDYAVEKLGEHRPWGDFRGGKYSIFEAGTRVPMIVRWPAHTKAGEVSDALVSHIDIFRSLSEVCGGKIPEGAAPDSEDNLSTLLGGEGNRDFVVEHNLTGTLSITQGDWKYIEPSDKFPYLEHENIETGNSTVEQLYNVAEDRNERHNLVKEYPEKAAQLRTMLDSLRRL